MKPTADEIFWWVGFLVCLFSSCVLLTALWIWTLEKLVSMFRIKVWVIRYIINHEKFKQYWEEKESKKKQVSKTLDDQIDEIINRNEEGQA